MLRAFLIIFFASIQLSALSTGNPSNPGMIDKTLFLDQDISAFAGYQRDWVFDRRLKAVNGVANGEFDTFRTYQNNAILGLNFMQRFDLYSLLGTADAHAKVNRVELNGDAGFAWMLGGTALVYQWVDFAIGVDGKFQRFKTHFDDGGKVRYDEWQMSVGGSYQISYFVPYLAMTYSNVTAYFKRLPVGLFPNITNFEAKNRRKFGLGVGSSVTNGSYGSVNAEVRLIDEWALILSGRLAF
ncbi:MAG: hypothetical protein SP1CHLAM54_14740 [Chlamydiia bacterium]|nr:hypothetical protein [Chlamydiia bacterium]MCH9616364.1 hypothetical protein [Chlamydiia bacterium]MCH9629650.1 hypothetical protein [Chlamydiia bacterium]